MPTPYIRTTISDGLAHVELDRAEKKNAMLLEMRDGLAEIFEALADNDDVRAVLLSGKGGDFCAGADISEMGKGGLAGSLYRVRHMQRLMRAMVRLQKPVVAAVGGVAVGMGFSMALACDVVLAGESARFGQVQRKIALPPDAGAVWFLTRYLGILRAKELVLSGRMVPAQEALGLGLVSQVLPDAELLETARALALEYAQGPTVAFGIGKRMFDLAPSSSFDDFLEHEASMVPLSVTSDDFKEGTRAFLEKRKPAWTGA
jgi:2-(1,2-epoxy-1,2-dihydrophenyl)acetyl-CoA isomerase